jgi:hypothetical protein
MDKFRLWFGGIGHGAYNRGRIVGFRGAKGDIHAAERPMILALATEQHAPREHERWQFRTRSLLWLMFTAAMTLAYARVFGERATFVIVLTPLVALVVGASLGTFTHRMAPAIYWAIVGGMAGAICVVAAMPLGTSLLLLWPIVGAVAGGFAGASKPPLTALRVLQTAVAGGGVAAAVFLFGGSTEILVDLAFAPFVAAGLAIVVRLVDSLHHVHRSSRDAWAAGLLFAVIAANLWTAFAAGRL